MLYFRNRKCLKLENFLLWEQGLYMHASLGWLSKGGVCANCQPKQGHLKGFERCQLSNRPGLGWSSSSTRQELDALRK